MSTNAYAVFFHTSMQPDHIYCHHRDGNGIDEAVEIFLIEREGKGYSYTMLAWMEWAEFQAIQPRELRGKQEFRRGLVSGLVENGRGLGAKLEPAAPAKASHKVAAGTTAAPAATPDNDRMLAKDLKPVPLAGSQAAPFDPFKEFVVHHTEAAQPSAQKHKLQRSTNLDNISRHGSAWLL